MQMKEKIPAVYDFHFNSENDYEETNTLLYCCGVVEIGEFSCTYGKDWDNIPPEVIQGIKKRFRNFNRMLIATTTTNQDEPNSVLEQCGWTRVSDYINPNSGNRVILWNFVP